MTNSLNSGTIVDNNVAIEGQLLLILEADLL
jgi:hypothetical protein